MQRSVRIWGLESRKRGEGRGIFTVISRVLAFGSAACLEGNSGDWSN